ncbi:hypothetical protein AX774_g6989 [Zancudomyces culisetae]|uniref:Uncharacterized protein n=1 Tax=Zancudomyces culisetae TaxID=1213189 RepID=A0A1R1PF96_ZANCU|nr:hypothetical protein AX774_g6989 [Zancudomyces culisetae]|eukprot:OMH79588.1 hypothetical protein AX774_g6989 [Zancudomyces culisetae]
MPSITSILSVLRSSHGLALNSYGLDVNAPTGHKSTIFPDISESSVLSTYVPICILFPRPVVPNSGTPATSFANRTHLVHWIHRVIVIFTSGPISLSSTALFSSLNRLLSLPYLIDCSCKSHSPAWSHTGQSSGWFDNINSITPSLVCFTLGLSVSTRIPGITGIAHDAASFGLFSISTKHIRQFPAMPNLSCLS